MTAEQELSTFKAKVNIETALLLKKITDLQTEVQEIRNRLFGEPVLHASEDMELESSGHLTDKQN